MMLQKICVLFISVYLVGCSSAHPIPNDKQKFSNFYQQLSNQPIHENPINHVKTLDCQSLQSGKTIELTGNVQLPKNCDLWQKNVHFLIQQSHVNLDCQGVLMSTTNDNLTAFTIQTPKNVQKNQGIRNISLKNCAMLGYKHGILIQQQLPANQRYQQLLNKQTNIDEQKQQSPQQILLNRVLVANSKHSGIFIGDHVQKVDIINSMVIQSGTVGIYFEFGSGQNSVTYSQFFGNGFRQILGMGKPNREAIAIDSSDHNRIAYNQFLGNGAGGIFLYRNCFEHANDPTKSNHFLRTQGSNHNQIFANSFHHEPVGVWVASRQSRNLKGFQCGAYLIEKSVMASYHLDESEYNLIKKNTFNKVEKAIIIEDDNNQIFENIFSQYVDNPLMIGSDIREKSNESVVKNNMIRNNRFYQSNLTLPLIKFVGKSENNNQYCGNIANNTHIIDKQCVNIEKKD